MAGIQDMLAKFAADQEARTAAAVAAARAKNDILQVAGSERCRQLREHGDAARAALQVPPMPQRADGQTPRHRALHTVQPALQLADPNYLRPGMGGSSASCSRRRHARRMLWPWCRRRGRGHKRQRSSGGGLAKRCRSLCTPALMQATAPVRRFVQHPCTRHLTGGGGKGGVELFVRCSFLFWFVIFHKPACSLSQHAMLSAGSALRQAAAEASQQQLAAQGAAGRALLTAASAGKGSLLTTAASATASLTAGALVEGPMGHRDAAALLPIPSSSHLPMGMLHMQQEPVPWRQEPVSLAGCWLWVVKGGQARSADR